jgi:hypothetical protein
MRIIEILVVQVVILSSSDLFWSLNWDSRSSLRNYRSKVPNNWGAVVWFLFVKSLFCSNVLSFSLQVVLHQREINNVPRSELFHSFWFHAFFFAQSVPINCKFFFVCTLWIKGFLHAETCDRIENYLFPNWLNADFASFLLRKTNLNIHNRCLRRRHTLFVILSWLYSDRPPNHRLACMSRRRHVLFVPLARRDRPP